MSSTLPHNIQPVPAAQFYEPQYPQWQLILRLVLALLVLAYAFFVPSRLVATTYNLFLLGTFFYVALQSLFWLAIILNRINVFLLYAITTLDVAAALAIVCNDPAMIPPSLIIAVTALALAVTHHRFRSFTAIFSAFLLCLVAVLVIRHYLMEQKYDVYFAAMILFSITAAAATLVISAHAETLSLRAARVTETDPITGLGNRWTFYEAAKYLLPFHHRNLTPMVVMYAEIEITKEKGKRVTQTINEYLLKQFASIIDQRLRGYDIAVRYGGNEFAFLLADTTSKEAEKIAYDMQQQFDNWARKKDLPAYVHFGMAIIPARPIAMDQILININAALHRARQYKKGVSGAVFADPEQPLR